MPTPDMAGNRLDTLLETRNEMPAEWSEPTAFDLSIDADRAALEELLDGDQPIKVLDRSDEIANELFEEAHPDQKGDDALRLGYVERIKEQGSRFGKWFFFNWSGEVVHYPDQDDHRALRTSRNKDLITAGQQDELYSKAVLVGGLSVGSNVTREMVASGIGGTLIIGDFDTISPSNLNRINGGLPDVGRTKISQAAIAISEADPYINQIHLTDGITPEALQRLADEDNLPDIMFDEVDNLQAKLAMRKFAQEHGIPLVMVTDVGDRSIVDVERYDQGDAKPFNGRLSEATLQKIEDGTATPQEVKGAMVKIVGLGNISTKMLISFGAVGKTLPGVPQLGSTASKGGALAAMTAREILLGGKMPTGRYVDNERKTLGLARDNFFTKAGVVLGMLRASKRAA